MKNNAWHLFIVTLFLLKTPVPAQIASGGPYAINKAAIAGGGMAGTGGDYEGLVTTAQSIAGTISSGGSYRVESGFWAQKPLVPTSAVASISGRVIGPRGRGINGAIITLNGASLSRSALTNGFGYFTFENIGVGEFYILTVRHRAYIFTTNNYAFTLVDDITGIQFHTKQYR